MVEIVFYRNCIFTRRCNKKQITILRSSTQSLFSGQLCAKFSMEPTENAKSTREWMKNAKLKHRTCNHFTSNILDIEYKSQCQRCQKVAPQDLVLPQGIEKKKLLSATIQVFFPPLARPATIRW